MNDRPGEGDVEIQIAVLDHANISTPWGGGHILDIVEAFGAQECFDDVERSETDGRLLLQADRGRLRRALVGERYPGAEGAAAMASDALARK